MIFLSYSWADAWLVHAWAASLRNETPLWLDLWYLDLGLPLVEQIEAAINEATMLAVVDSASARSSKWVHLEVEIAARSGLALERLPLTQVIRAWPGSMNVRQLCKPWSNQGSGWHEKVAGAWRQRSGMPQAETTVAVKNVVAPVALPLL